jgi:calcium-dependent protein kinase
MVCGCAAGIILLARQPLAGSMLCRRFLLAATGIAVKKSLGDSNGDGSSSSSRNSSRRCRASSISFAKQYEVGEVFGKGTFGTVSMARERGRDTVYVLKVVDKSCAKLRKDYPEAEIHAALDHPNIAKVYDTFTSASRICILMELCRGGDLFDALDEDRRVCSESEARNIFGQIMCAVGYLHRCGLVHRDLKLENCLIKESDVPLSKCTIKLIDFGFATRVEAGGASLKTACGSIEYMAPEILKRRPYGEKCDVWSCGVVLYTLLSGCMPFDGKNRGELVQNIKDKPVVLNQPSWRPVSQELRHLVTSMCCKDVDQRLTSQQVIAHPWLQAAVAKLVQKRDACRARQGGA